MKFRIFVQAFCAAALLSVPSHAQETWTRYHKTNQITDIAVHGDNIWCATTGGLVRWDRKTGMYQEIPEKNDSAYNIVTTIEAAPDGSIWGIVRGDTYATNPSWLKSHPPTYLVHYDGNSWSEYDTLWYDYGTPVKDSRGYPWPQSATSLAVGSDGTVWAGVSYDIQDMNDYWSVGSGLSRYKDGLWSNTQIGSWTYEINNFLIETGAKYLVTSVAAAADGRVMASTSGSGVFQYDGQTVRSVEGGGSGTLYIGPDGSVWLVGAKTIQRRDGEAWASVTIPSELLSGNINAFACEASNRLWAGTTAGLLRFDGTAWKRYVLADGLVDNSVSSLAMDDSGVLWIGTSNGLASFDGVSFHSYRMEDRLVNENIRALAFEPNGTVWAGTSSGLSRYNGVNWYSFTMADGLPDSTIHALTVTPQGNVWVVTSKGVARYYGSGWKTYTTADGLASNTVYAMASGKDGTVWLGTDAGVSCFDGMRWRNYSSADGLPKANYALITTTPDGAVWTVGANSIFRYHENQWNRKSTIDGGEWYYTSYAGLTADQDGSILVAYNHTIGDGHYTNRAFFINRIGADSTETEVADSGGVFFFIRDSPG